MKRLLITGQDEPRQSTGAECELAIEMHLAGMVEDGEPIPQPRAAVEYVDAAA